jgi:hypothetical protein
MKTTIDISDELLQRVRKTARRESTTLKQLAEEGLRLALDRRPRRTAKFKPHVVKGRGVAPDLSGKKLTALLYDDEMDRTLKR